MSELMRLDEEYRSWIQELGDRYRTSQIKASIRVNNEMLRLQRIWVNQTYQYIMHKPII